MLVCEFPQQPNRHHFTIQEARFDFHCLPVCAAFLAHYGKCQLEIRLDQYFVKLGNIFYGFLD